VSIKQQTVNKIQWQLKKASSQGLRGADDHQQLRCFQMRIMMVEGQ
jgi:hypothetical protein